MGQVHGRSYRQIVHRFPDSPLQPRLVICADDVESRLRDAQASLGFERQTTDWQKVIEDPDVEVVNIATPNNLHLEIAERAAKAGKHIFCEKPVGRSPQETAVIERAAHQAGVMTFVGYNYRWAPLVQYGWQLVQDGTLGRLTHYRGRFFAGYASNPRGVLSWRFREELAGLGVCGDLMSHAVDMAHLMVGPVRKLVSTRHTFIPERPPATAGQGTHFTTSEQGSTEKVTNEDYVGALVEFENGARGTLETCRVINGPRCEMAFELNGTLGAIKWNFEEMNELQLFLSEENGARQGYTRILSGPEHPFHVRFNPSPGTGLGYDDLKVIEAHEFLRSIANGKLGTPSFSEALAVANVQNAIIRSWDTGNWERIESVSALAGVDPVVER
jgi:predicted dehydrogenase